MIEDFMAIKLTSKLLHVMTHINEALRSRIGP